MRKFILVSLSFFLLMACSKKGFKKGTGESPCEEPQPASCRIDSIYPVEKGRPAMNRWTAVGVHYNDKGNPALANYELVHYGHMKFSVSFIYDSKDRLIELTAPVGYEMDEGFYTTPRRVKYVYQGDSPLPVR